MDKNYWFVIEPYVYISVTKKEVLLYNTLDGVTLESEKVEVVKLMHEVIEKENFGVVFLISDRLYQSDIHDFVMMLRENFMGDIIDAELSSGKPVQISPYTNFYVGNDLYIKHNFSSLKNVLNNLLEVNAHVDNTIKIDLFISFLQSLPENITINIIGNLKSLNRCNDLFCFLYKRSNLKNFTCSYRDIMILESNCMNNFSYRILVQFPVDKSLLIDSINLLKSQTAPYEYLFSLTSLDDYQQAEHFVEQYQLKKYYFKPVYTGCNIDFLKEHVFLTKEDILSTPMSLKNFFTNQAVNSNDFGKIHIKPNGDVYANLSFSSLGNIYQQNIYELLQKEIDEGQSWFRIRNHEPCNTCVYQWLCPPPSDLEIAIGQLNLCHVKSI